MTSPVPFPSSWVLGTRPVVIYYFNWSLTCSSSNGHRQILPHPSRSFSLCTDRREPLLRIVILSQSHIPRFVQPERGCNTDNNGHFRRGSIRCWFRSRIFRHSKLEYLHLILYV